MLRIENLCCLVGFDERQTATFVKGKLLEYARELYSEEHKRKFTTEKTGFQVVKEPTNGTRLVLAINRKAYCRVVQRANSISYGRAYTDLYSRKGKAGEWRYNGFVLPENNKKVPFIKYYEWHFHYICTRMNKDRAN